MPNVIVVGLLLLDFACDFLSSFGYIRLYVSFHSIAWRTLFQPSVLSAEHFPSYFLDFIIIVIVFVVCVCVFAFIWLFPFLRLEDEL